MKLPSLQGGQSFTSRLSFRAKLLLVLFVPFLALVVVAAAGLSDRFADLHAQEQYGDVSGALSSLDAASRALENESVVSSWFVASGGAPAAELQQARTRTDAAVKAFRLEEGSFATVGLSPSAFAALEATNKGFDEIPATRKDVDALSVDAAATRNFFLGVDENLLNFGERVGRDLASADIAVSLSRVSSLQRAQHELAREASVYIAVLASGSPQSFSEWVGAQAARAQHLASFHNTATPEELAAFDTVKGADAPAADLPTAFPATSTTPGEYYVDYQQQTKTLDHAIDAVTGVINRTASAHADSAMSDVRLYGGAAVFAMLLTLALIWFVARAVVDPVRKLTAAAREMSQRQLPALVEQLRTGGDVSAIQPVRVEVSSEDEIGDLAQAFNDVEAVTLEVAQEQSRLLRKGMGDLFVNLARRNQSLVQRQLELLDDLERNEHDPAALDALFKLDHMATRMRRNAESLLVLSGAEQPRQWQQPIALIDVVRAAAAEIADFPRVDLVAIDDQLAVSGRAVSDLAHLLAELLENATSFSPPETPVVVSGAVSASGFVIAITDQGIGMTHERIAEANKLLAEPPVVGLALTRALGLHVVGSLAARHGIAIELRPGAPCGIVALVGLPTAILEPRAQRPPTAPVTRVTPSLDDEIAPLGARREVSRPPDEPPVEEWGRATMAGPAPTAPTPPAADDITITTSAPSAYDVPPAFDTPPPASTYEAPSAFDTPPPASTYEAPPAFDTTSPSFDTPPPASTYEAPPAFDATPPAYDEPPTYTAPPPADEPPPIEDAPLPTRVPGQHLSHHPQIDGEADGVDADPMRPYRVHELLTRHAQGKRRGRTGEDAPGSSEPFDTTSPGHVQEDGR